MAIEQWFVIGTNLDRAQKLAGLYGKYAVQIKEVQSPVLGCIVLISARPEHRQFFMIITNMFSSLIEEYGFTITQNPRTELFQLFLKERQSI